MKDKKKENKVPDSFPGDFDTLMSIANNDKKCKCTECKCNILKPEFISL